MSQVAYMEHAKKVVAEYLAKIKFQDNWPYQLVIIPEPISASKIVGQVDGRRSLMYQELKEPLKWLSESHHMKNILSAFQNGAYAEVATVEYVSVIFNGKRLTMIVDDDGHGKGLTQNNIATCLYWNNWILQGKIPDAPIVGAAILLNFGISELELAHGIY